MLTLIALTYKFNEAAHNAEGRLAVIEAYLYDYCESYPDVNSCNIIKSNY